MKGIKELRILASEVSFDGQGKQPFFELTQLPEPRCVLVVGGEDGTDDEPERITRFDT